MAFEVFKEAGTRAQVFISVTETKAFGLSRAFVDKFGITKAHKAVILYDADTKKIALHFSTNNPAFGFAVQIPNPKHGASIVARSFFDVKDIDPKLYAGRYDKFEKIQLKKLGVDKDGTAFVLQLKNSNTYNKQNKQINVTPQPIDLSQIPF